MATQVIYGEGGYNPELPNDNIIEVIELPDVVDETETIRQSALEKLSKLGLTQEEIVALMGGV